MLKACQRACALAAMSLFLVAGSGTANAFTLNIIDYIDNNDAAGNYPGVGERTVTQDLNFNNPSDGVKVEAYGTLGANQAAVASIPTGYPSGVGDVYAYLDGGGAGMGVCSGGLKSGNQCNTGSDDNVGVGANGQPGQTTEILSFSLDNNWDLDNLLFRDEGHRSDFYRNDPDETERFIYVAVDGVDLDGNGASGAGDFVLFELEDLPTSQKDDLGASLLGWASIQNLSKDAFEHLKNYLPANGPYTQFYLSGIELSLPGGSTTEVPLPAGIVLLLTGLAGLGASSRFRKKAA